MKKVGFFFVDKPEGYTSKDCDSVIKRDFNLKKAGHLGTLDPFATGLLIVGVSDATKLFTLIDDEKKTYVATLELGVLTDTLDCTGTIIKKEEVQPLSLSKIQETLTSFLGNSTQEVPLYSAKHIDGVRAYHLAREGSKVKPPSIQIHISSIRLLSYQHPFLTFEAEVSKGTYLRSLGRDIAEKLHTIGSLTKLRRTSIGSYDVKEATELNQLTDENLISIREMFSSYVFHECKEKEKKALINGNPLALPYSDEFVFLTIEDEVLSLYQRREDGLYYSYRGFSRCDR